MHTVSKNLATLGVLDFAAHNSSILHIQTEEEYTLALNIIEDLMNNSEDSLSDPLNSLIALTAPAIKNYESSQEDLITFEREVSALDPGISMLRHLMSQYKLTVSNFQNEIGSKSLVSMILNSKRNLTKEHIMKLSKRFNISPSLFF